MKRKSLILLIIFVLLGNFAYGSATFSHDEDPQGKEFTEGIRKAQEFASGAGLSKETDVFKVIANVIQFLLALSAVLAMGAIVWGGIQYIMSLGNDSKAEHAKDIIKYAIYGIIVVLISFVIISFIKNQLTAVNPFGITTVYAQSTSTTSVSKGFTSGIDAINRWIKPKESGLATDPDLLKVILRVVNFLLSLIAVLALAVMVWGAIKYILSVGDESKAEEAKRTILFAIIGVLLAGISFLILRVLRLFLTGS